MNKIEQAVDNFHTGFNCAQAILGSYADRFGLECETAFRIAAGFGGGMRMGSVCGAVTGAYMVLGLKFGSSVAHDKKSKADTYEQVTDFTARFQAARGSVMCKDLLGCDISSPEGYQQARQNDLFNTVCPRMVQTAAEIIEDLFAENSKY
ncbi:MAG: C_GCAxxG_C_C family protein [Sedimentisphaerales bacterium]|nr:C_GCAxxG_C_C family protein [Sedimentisphaerales bacterium]